jgi:hypothetical protein
MLYEMTTGSRAFAGSSDAEIITALLTCEVEPPSRRVADYPPELERIVLRCLSRERGGRPSSGRELIEELEACAVSCDWTMRSVSLGVFVRSLFPAHLEAEAPSASGPRASAPRSSTPTPPVSAPRQMSTLPMIGPDALMQAEIDVTVDDDAGPRQPLRDASTLLIVTFLVVASALFWLVVYPRLG